MLRDIQNALFKSRTPLIAVALVLAALGVLDAALYGIFTHLVFAVVLVAAALKARDGSQTPVKVMTVAAAIQGLLVLAFLLFGGEDISAAETTLAVLLVLGAASTTTLGIAALRATPPIT